ncbi:MAG: terpene cyclase/mutase family protein [Planctomycetes bacterium]|nr:terpene cyclase/mutase family protein [Planctomycetota bacterium]
MTRIIFAALLLVTACLAGVVAQDSPEFGPPRGEEEVRDPKPTPQDLEVQKVVDKGLKHLASIQNNDGSWSNDVGNKLGNSYQRNIDGIGKPHLGVTAICCMAFMAAGHTPDRGEFHINVSKGLAFVLSNIDRDTGWISNYGTRMYSHAFCSMFLAEVYGQTRDPVVLSNLRNAIRFIVESQNRQGSWRYVPNQADSDMSICVCQLQALRAASNVGVLVPKKSIEDAKDYVRKSYNTYASPGSFKYQIDWDDRSTFALTAAGVVALQSLGEYDTHTYIGPSGQTIKLDLNKSISYLLAARPDRVASWMVPGTRVCDYGFWYGHYYAAQAMYQYQFVSKRTWEEWNKKNREHFMRLQHPNGAWTDEIGGFDPDKNAFATAMACLILSIPRGYLPIFQN